MSKVAAATDRYVAGLLYLHPLFTDPAGSILVLNPHILYIN